MAHAVRSAIKMDKYNNHTMQFDCDARLLLKKIELYFSHGSLSLLTGTSNFPVLNLCSNNLKHCQVKVN